MSQLSTSKPSVRARADRIKDFRCKNLIAVLEDPYNIWNIGSVIRNVNVLGVEKVYVASRRRILPADWHDMRGRSKLNAVSASAIKWSFVKTFASTTDCLDHLEANGFVSMVTSPYAKGRENVVLHEHDYTPYKKLAIWFGNEASGISEEVVDRSLLCINIPMYGMVESLNLATSSGIVLYEVAKQRRAFQLDPKRRRTARGRPGVTRPVRAPLPET